MKSIILSGNQIEKVERYKLDELTEGLYIPVNYDHLRVYIDNNDRPVFLLNLIENQVLCFDPNEWTYNFFVKDTNTTAITFNL